MKNGICNNNMSITENDKNDQLLIRMNTFMRKTMRILLVKWLCIVFNMIGLQR